MSRGLGRVERVCLSVLAEAEGDEPVVGRTADDIVLVAFGIGNPYAHGAGYNAPDDEKYLWRDSALSSVHRSLRRLIARGLVQENGLSEGYNSHEGLVDCNGQPYKDKRMINGGRKLYRAPGQRPIHLPDLSKVPPA